VKAVDAGEQYLSSAAEDALPGEPFDARAPECPGNLPRRAGISRNASHFSVSRDFPSRDAANGALNIFEIAHIVRKPEAV
jgi:hypothetical protein